MLDTRQHAMTIRRRLLARELRERVHASLVPTESYAEFCERVREWTVEQLRDETARLRRVRGA